MDQKANGGMATTPVVHFSWRSVIVGSFIGCVVTAMNAYLGLKTGWTFGASIIAAILGYSFFAAIRPKQPVTALEINIAQTAGSAAGAMTAAAGFVAAIPAMAMLGFTFSYAELFIWALAVAYIGVFYAVPLRRQVVLIEKLRFPSGTATAETITAMFSSGEEALTKSKALVGWGLFAAAFALATFFVPQIGHPPMEWIWLGALSAWGFSLYINPLMTGAGLLMGPRVGASLLFGAVVAWGIVGPYAQAQGWAPGDIMEYKGGPRGWILWPGVAIMVSDALANLALSWKSIIGAFRPLKGGGDVEDNAPDTIPNSWWMGGLAVSTVATTCAAYYVFGIPPFFTVLAIAMSWILALIAVRAVGETDINPIGGMGKVTQVVFGGLAPGQMGTNLMSAAITASGASQAADMMQDLKTGHILGASPRAQFKAQLIGIFAGVLVCVPVYALFDKAYQIGIDENVPAPAAHAWRAMAELLSKGLGALPPHSETAVALGVLFGAAVPFLKKSPKLAPFLPSAMAVGIAFIVHAYFSITMFIGAMILVLWERRNPVAADQLAFPIASGLVAGEGLMGILVAILILLGVSPLL